MTRHEVDYIKQLHDRLGEQTDKRYHALQWRQKYQRLTEPKAIIYDDPKHVIQCMVRLQELENMIDDFTLIYNKPTI